MLRQPICCFGEVRHYQIISVCRRLTENVNDFPIRIKVRRTNTKLPLLFSDRELLSQIVQQCL